MPQIGRLKPTLEAGDARLPGFAVISGCGWLLDVTVMMALVLAGVGPFAANLVGAACGVGFVFVAVQRRIFRPRDGPARRWGRRALLTRYVLWQAVAIPVASAVLALIATTLAAGLAADGPLAPLQHLAATVLGAVAPAPLAAALAAPATLGAGIGKVAVTALTLYANFLFTGWLMEGRLSWR